MAKHEYRILSRSTQGALVEIVEEFLDAGWQLVGGIVIHDEKEYVQAEGYDPVEEEVVKFYQAILRVEHPRPMAEIRVADEEVVLYSEN